MKLTGEGKAIINQVINDIRRAQEEIAEAKSIINARTKGVGLDAWRSKLTKLEAYYSDGETRLERFRRNN